MAKRGVGRRTVLSIPPWTFSFIQVYLADVSVCVSGCAGAGKTTLIYKGKTTMRYEGKTTMIYKGETTMMYKA